MFVETGVKFLGVLHIMSVLLISNLDTVVHCSTLSSVKTVSTLLAGVFTNTTAPTIVSAR